MEEPENKIINKRKHKYYVCDCGEHLKVVNTIKTDWYGTLEYMKGCKNCCEKGEQMVVQNNKFLGIAA